MREVLIRLLAIQALTGLAIAAGFCVRVSVAAGVAAIYGSAVGLIVSLLLAWRMSRASQPGAGLQALYLGAFERMVFVGLAFGVAIGLLRLAPLALIAGFVGAELAYYIAAGPLRRYMMETIGSEDNGE